MTTDIRPLETADGLGYELRIDAPPEIVWRLWTEPDAMVRWMGKVASLAPVPGGMFRVDYGQGDTVAGEFTSVEPIGRLALTWGWETPEGRSPAGTVEVELVPADGGEATILRLRHLGLDAESRTSHDQGWRHFLPRLVEAAGA